VLINSLASAKEFIQTLIDKHGPLATISYQEDPANECHSFIISIIRKQTEEEFIAEVKELYERMKIKYEKENAVGREGPDLPLRL